MGSQIITSWTSYCQFSACYPFTVDLGSGMGQRDRRTDRRQPSMHYASPYGDRGITMKMISLSIYVILSPPARTLQVFHYSYLPTACNCTNQFHKVDMCYNLGDRNDIRPVKSWVLVCWWWHFDWSFARHIAPVVTTTSITLSSNKIRNGDILVPANTGPPGKWPLKRRRGTCVIITEKRTRTTCQVNSLWTTSRWCSDCTTRFLSRQWSLAGMAKFPHSELVLCRTAAYWLSCIDIVSLHNKSTSEQSWLIVSDCAVTAEHIKLWLLD